MPTYLDQIIKAHRKAATLDSRNLEDLIDQAEQLTENSNLEKLSFKNALSQKSSNSVKIIAEIKRRSPSKGSLSENLDPVLLAKAYSQGGASCISVLTDQDFFGGSPKDLQQVRQVVDLPILRKDFTISKADICDAKLMGADAILLIVAALSKVELFDFLQLANRLRLDALVEVHDEKELDIALEIGAQIIGVNQRDLFSFKVDINRAEQLVDKIPDSVVKVAESGISQPQDLSRLAKVGFDAALIGEAFVTSQDPQMAIEKMKLAGTT